MKFALVTLNSLEYAPLADLTFTNNKLKYCEKHGYSTFHRTGGPSCGVIGFDKLYFLRELLDSDDSDWFFWCGCDSLITNFNRTLKSFVESEEKDFIIGRDVNGINADAFFLRNSVESKRYLALLLGLFPNYRGHFWFEQQAIIDTHALYPEIVKVISQKAFNAYDYALYPQHAGDPLAVEGQWEPGDFLIHWPGTSLQHRIELAKTYLNKITGIPEE